MFSLKVSDDLALTVLVLAEGKMAEMSPRVLPMHRPNYIFYQEVTTDMPSVILF
jgi:hypothetical protein